MPRRAIVTGASTGIGRETALLLARSGIEVIAGARRSAELAALAVGGTIRPVPADVTHPDGIARVLAAAGREPIAILVHGAGVFPRGRLDDLQATDWDAAWRTNVSSRGYRGRKPPPPFARVLATYRRLRTRQNLKMPVHPDYQDKSVAQDPGHLGDDAGGVGAHSPLRRGARFDFTGRQIWPSNHCTPERVMVEITGGFRV